MTAPLRKRFPRAKIIALHVEKPPENPEEPDSKWYPETGLSVQDFLEAEIPDSKAEEIRLLEWRPALSVFGGAYLSLIEETVEFIKRADAGARTLSVFGRNWFRNFFKNLDIIKNILCPAQFSIPFLVTGAGPSLEDAIPLIRENRPGLFILATASSLAALKAQNLNPDLVTSTDGSAWAKIHLNEIFTGTNGIPLAATLAAALPSQAETLPVLPISDGSFWQTLILKELGIPHITMPQRGTVSASALDLAFALSQGEIFIAGMDLANRDIRSHARPYSLDRLMEEKAERINPVYSQTYKRSSMLKAGGSYDIYASWFKKQLNSYPKKLHALGGNNPIFGLSDSMTSSTFPHRVLTDFRIIPCKTDSRKAHSVLEKALKDNFHSEIQKELSLLLLPDNTETPLVELINAIRSILSLDRGEKNG
ncbi:MAG: DUF115 domain-containing protein [Treponema sp.]|nr:DUF115 domain-containing protein [Treponema sp.]